MGKIIIGKYGGVTSYNPDRIREALMFADKYIKEGSFPILVFSAPKYETSYEYINGTTDLLDCYRRIILGEDSLERGIKSFSAMLEEPYFSLAQKLGLSEQSLENRIRQITNKAIDTAKVLAQTPEDQVSEAREAFLLSLGERPVVLIVSELANKLYNQGGLAYKAVAVPDVGLITDNNWKDANIDEERTVRPLLERIEEFRKRKELPIVAGYKGITYLQEKEVPVEYPTVLGRGGSDSTGIFIGYAFELLRKEAGKKHFKVWCDGVEVYLMKDTKGVLSANDKTIQRAKTIPNLTYGLAAEAGNVQAKSVGPAEKIGMPIYIMDPRSPEEKTVVSSRQLSEGLYIVMDPRKCMYMEVGVISNVPDALYHFFDKYTQGKGINIVEIGHEESHTAFVIDSGIRHLEGVKEGLGKHGVDVQLTPGYYIRTVGVITPPLRDRFNSFLMQYLREKGVKEPLRDARWQKGIRALTCTLPTDGIDPYDAASKIHDEFILRER